MREKFEIINLYEKNTEKIHTILHRTCTHGVERVSRLSRTTRDRKVLRFTEATTKRSTLFLLFVNTFF